MTPTCPAPTDRSGFTLVEAVVALAVASLLVAATASVLLSVLRLEEAGDIAQRRTLGLHSLLVRHFLPEAGIAPEEAAKVSVDSGLDNTVWVIYTLTPFLETDSFAGTLALRRE